MWTLLENIELRKKIITLITNQLTTNARIIRGILTVMALLFAILISAPVTVQAYLGGSFSVRGLMIYWVSSVFIGGLVFLIGKLVSASVAKRAMIWKNSNIYFITGNIIRKRQGGTPNNRLIWWDVLADGNVYECSVVLAKSGGNLDGKHCVILAPDIDYIQRINRRNQDSYCFILEDFFQNDVFY